MNPERSLGIVLRTRPLTETSLIVHWLTPRLGRVGTVAKGARRPKSPFRGKVDLFYEADFSFQRSRRSDLHTLREINVTAMFPGLRLDIIRLSQAAYFSAIIEQTTETETPLDGVYDLLRGALTEIEKHPPHPAGVFAFELRMLEILGLRVDATKTSLSEGCRKLVRELGCADWRNVFMLRLSASQVSELRQFLHGYLIYHLERVPAGRGRAVEIES